MCNIKKIRRLRTPIPHTIIIWTWLHSLIQKKPAFNAKEAIIGRINSYDQFQMQGRTLLKIFFYLLCYRYMQYPSIVGTSLYSAYSFLEIHISLETQFYSN